MELYQIISNEQLAPLVNRYVVYAPEIARKRLAGQFVIIRVWSGGERIPLTIADADADAGTITLVVQNVGKTTAQLSLIEAGQCLQDVVGPLGSPTHIERFGTVVCIGGGIGLAPLFPITQAMKRAGNHVISILGARTKELLILEKEMSQVSDEFIITTDDGSHGRKGFVTHALQGLIDQGRRLDLVLAIGPAIMMKMVAQTTLPHKIPTIVSLNTVMIDGTGMCGCCRVQVGQQTKFVCVDGPEFDAHLVNWEEMMRRLGMYRDHECRAMARWREQSQAEKQG